MQAEYTVNEQSKHIIYRFGAGILEELLNDTFPQGHFSLDIYSMGEQKIPTQAQLNAFLFRVRNMQDNKTGY